jgi:hypothetical protein
VAEIFTGQEGHGMLMVYCMMYHRQSQGISRSSKFDNFKISMIKDHESSTHHVRISPRFNMSIEKSEGAKCVRQKY